MHTKLKRFFLLVLAVALLAATGTAVRPLSEMRTRYELTNEPVTGVSPQLALATQVFGWARGIIIDVIWIRMEALKRECRYYEMVQLADWACKLAPRIPTVWDIQSWNMAYNVTVYIDKYEERWPWVKTGMELLRDQAIPANPNSIVLYQRLAWLIFHKIGQEDDNAHMFYKEAFARLMHEALGGSGDRDTLQSFIDAPETVEELRQDEDVAYIIDTCNRLGFDIVSGFFLWYHDVKAVPEQVNDLLGRPDNVAPLKRIAAYVRAKKLREELRLEPERMLKLVDAYGPFDWRGPYAHAVYWAVVGLERLAEAQGRLDAMVDEYGLPEPRGRAEFDYLFDDSEGIYEWERINLERVIYGSLQSLVRQGRMLFNDKGLWLKEWGPDYRFADAVVVLFDRAWKTWLPRYRKGIRSGYVTFLGGGVAEFYFMGDNDKSREYYDMLKEEFPEHVGKMSYDDYLQARIMRYTVDLTFEDTAMTFSEVRRLVRGLYSRAFLNLAYGEEDVAAKLEKQAESLANGFAPERAERLLRERVRADEIRRSVLVDLLTGQVRASPVAIANLKAKLGPETVKSILESVEGTDRGLPETEEVPDELKTKPSLQ